MKLTLQIDEQTATELSLLHTLYRKANPESKVGFINFAQHVIKVSVKQNRNSIKNRIMDMVKDDPDSDESRRKLLEQVQWQENMHDSNV